ncbi:MAG: FAD:protein FMN transferase [Oscillospiraceae bacterium]|jgi:thiamine biosynthesis lipoprotein|nr:FAD:protein FMN transferase [Oscillospiraceae bacterium]
MSKSLRLRALCLVLCAALTACAPAGPTAEPTGPETRVRDNLMNTVVTLSLYDHASDGLFAALFDRIAAIEDGMSVHRAGSGISRLNAGAGADSVPLPSEVRALLREALDIAALSKGAFDPTVGALTALWAIGTPEARVPAQSELDAALPLVDCAALTVDEAAGSARLSRPGMRVDLGGIAKGYAGDETLRLAREAGVEHAIFNLGGNIVVMGGNPDGTPWRIGVRTPLPGGEGYMGVLELSDGAVVTSGSYERYLEQDGARYHHILDPKTGYPADSGLLSVTVVYGNSARADGLSTACFVLGLEEGLALLTDIPGAEGVFVAADSRVFTTPGLSGLFRLTDPAYTLVTP